mmetsp:Transcript_65578/g.203160  ORF Transcript_65578/g.203160 Transcript_65578/m.203160 type:complete len:245 (-) Transcript_65578:242-976(-)
MLPRPDALGHRLAPRVASGRAATVLVHVPAQKRHRLPLALGSEGLGGADALLPGADARGHGLAPEVAGRRAAPVRVRIPAELHLLRRRGRGALVLEGLGRADPELPRPDAGRRGRAPAVPGRRPAAVLVRVGAHERRRCGGRRAVHAPDIVQPLLKALVAEALPRQTELACSTCRRRRGSRARTALSGCLLVVRAGRAVHDGLVLLLRARPDHLCRGAVAEVACVASPQSVPSGQDACLALGGR